MPSDFPGPFTQMQVRYAAGPFGANAWHLTVNIAGVPPAILDHQSILLDIVIGTFGVTHNENVLSSILADAQLTKDHIFEACITDASRELFNK